MYEKPQGISRNLIMSCFYLASIPDTRDILPYTLCISLKLGNILENIWQKELTKLRNYSTCLIGSPKPIF